MVKDALKEGSSKQGNTFLACAGSKYVTARVLIEGIEIKRTWKDYFKNLSRTKNLKYRFDNVLIGENKKRPTLHYLSFFVVKVKDFRHRLK